MTYLELVAGFIYLLLGGDLLVRGAVAMARRLRVPPVVVAATVVGFGTSLPELVVSVEATINGYPNLILGNVVGSNIANVLLVAGVAAVVFPLRHEEAAMRRNVALMMLATVGFAFVCLTGEIGRVTGGVLLAGFVVMLVSTAGPSFWGDRDTSIPLDWVLGIPNRPWTIGLFILAGIVMLPVGAQLLVDSAVEIAARLAVPETVVGLTVLALGTSLPELTTTVLAAREQRSDVAIGAVVGSNTFNILAIMGVTASLSTTPIPISSRFVWLDVPVMLVTSGFLGFLAWRAWPVGRRIGIGMLVAYGVYLTTLYLLV